MDAAKSIESAEEEDHFLDLQAAGAKLVYDDWLSDGESGRPRKWRVWRTDLGRCTCGCAHDFAFFDSLTGVTLCNGCPGLSGLSLHASILLGANKWPNLLPYHRESET